LNLVPNGTNGIYFTEFNSDKIGFLNMDTNEFTEWILPAGFLPQGLALQGQNVVFAETSAKLVDPAGNPSAIAVLDPATNMLTQWTIPQIATSSPQVPEVSVQNQFIFFSDTNQGAIGMLDTSNNLFTQWLLPGAPAQHAPNGIVTVQTQISGIHVWIADEQAQTITLFVPALYRFTEWPIPGLGADRTLEHLDVANGIVAFQDAALNFVATFDPVKETLREWTIPTPSSAPLYVSFLPTGDLSFSEPASNSIGLLGLTTPPNLETSTAPERYIATPQYHAVAPTMIPLAKTTILVPPTVARANRIVEGGFTEYPTPTALSAPAGIIAGDGGILFTEFSNEGNRIGFLH
jgi:streptogramin lyase